MHRTTLTAAAVPLLLLVIGLTDRAASAQTMAKAQVANLIAKVENGVASLRSSISPSYPRIHQGVFTRAKRLT